MRAIISFIAMLPFCFYSLFAVASEEQRESIEQWRVYTEARVSSVSAILFSFDGEDAALGIRCRSRAPEVYFMLSDQLPSSPDRALSMKVDGVTIDSGKWQRSSSGNGAFSLTPFSFIPHLIGKEGLIVTYQTQAGPYKVAAFYLPGIEQVVQRLENVCRVNM